MGEEANRIGKKLEGYGEKLFTGFGWHELARNTEIVCSRKSQHDKRTHGLDLLMSFKNPYLGGRQGIVVECKNWQMRSITQEKLNKWVKELISAIECAQSAQELENINLEDTNLCTGLLLVHANDEFDRQKFNSYLKNLVVPTKRNPINIFVAGNDEINRWNSLLDKIEKDFGEKFQFVYPSIEGSNIEQGKYITINQLYSKFIFAQDFTEITQHKNGVEYPAYIFRKIVFSFDEISIDGFKYIWSMFKFYQFPEAEELVFVFYPTKKGDVEFVKENFIKTLYQIPMPITQEIENKIRIEFIDNRDLSPIDSGRN